MRIATKFAVYPLSAMVAMVAASSAIAQTANGTSQPPQGPVTQTSSTQPSAGSPPQQQVAEVVVTGSHIARRDYVADSPIVTVDRAAIQAVGATTLDVALDELPQLDISASASSYFNGRGGQASVDLRGLGQQRTLVLEDGVRMQPSEPNGAVDLNTIPNALIDNVEIITGGASAVYGSDAVTGVVNLKLRPSFVGAEVDAQYGETEYGDGASEDVDALIGANFDDDRGNAYISFDYTNRDAVPYTSRSYLDNELLTTRLPQGVLNVNATNLPSQAFINSYFGAPQDGGVAAGTVKNSSPLIAFNTDGSLFVQSGPTGPINYRGTTADQLLIYNNELYGAAGNFFDAQLPLTRYNGFAHFDYDLTPTVKLYGQFLYTTYSALTGGPPAVAGSSTGVQLSVPVTNPFIPAALVGLLASRPNPAAPFTYATEMVALGDREEAESYNVYQAVFGGTGSLPFHDLTWNLYGTYGRTDYVATELNYPSATAMNALLNAPDGGASLCSGGYNPFGLQPLSAACAAYIRRNPQEDTIQEQEIVEGTVQGSLFELPAGPLKFAAGADYRNDTYSFQPDSEVSSGDLENYLPVFASSGSSDVGEVYAELLAPLVKDVFLVKQLNIDLAGRYSDYNPTGGVGTWSAQGDWTVVDQLRLRGGYSVATRAPSVGELFDAEEVSTSGLGTALPTSAGVGDPCDVHSAYRAGPNAAQVVALCLAQGVPAAVINSYTNTNPTTVFTTAGNTALKPETADTFTVGAVWQPRFQNPLFSNMSVSVDYYNILLDNAIGTITSITAVQRCFNADGSNPTYSASNYYCGLITRQSTTGLISDIVNPELNLAAFKTDGIDIEGDWAFGLGAVGLDDRDGKLAFTTDLNFLNSFDIQTLKSAPFENYADTIGNTQIDAYADAHPRWKANTSFSYSINPVELTLRWRFIGAMNNASNVGTNGTIPPVPAISYFDLDGVWHVTPKVNLQVGVINLADQNPPTVNTTIVGSLLTDASTYDLLGRRFYVALRARF